MYSKNWKSFVAIAVSALALTACNNKKDDGDKSSPYTGIWANTEAVSLYRGLEAKRVSPRDFCRQVIHSWRLHGIHRSDLSQQPHALLINSEGEVFSYSVTESAQTESFRQNNYRGTVNEAGYFTDALAQDNHRGWNLYDQEDGSDYDLSNGSRIFLSTDDSLRVFDQENRGLTYVRSTDLEMVSYSATVQRCLDKIREDRRHRQKVQQPGLDQVDQNDDGLENWGDLPDDGRNNERRSNK